MDDHEDNGSDLNYAAMVDPYVSYDGCLSDGFMILVRLGVIIMVVKAIFFAMALFLT